MARSGLLKALRRLHRVPVREEDFISIIKELRSDSDRASVMVYGSIIDEAIENALTRRMVALTPTEREQIFQGTGPLSSFSAKINIAYAFKIFGKMTKRDLHYIREVRNAFAHISRNLRFSTKEVSDVCAALHTPDNVPGISTNPENERIPVSFYPDGDKSNPRTRYEIACRLIDLNICGIELFNLGDQRALYLP
jgi:DNA-binding MltR family transcriptional regulator